MNERGTNIRCRISRDTKVKKNHEKSHKQIACQPHVVWLVALWKPQPGEITDPPSSMRVLPRRSATALARCAARVRSITATKKDLPLVLPGNCDGMRLQCVDWAHISRPGTSVTEQHPDSDAYTRLSQ